MAAILIVEEDGVLARQMVRTLRQAGHLPTLASTAQAALREAGEQPDVIVLDLE
jgi:DNA-binding response OmpR family regulator